jgi:peptidoglycan/LPS O-acetylase OafA/YrhL
MPDSYAGVRPSEQSSNSASVAPAQSSTTGPGTSGPGASSSDALRKILRPSLDALTGARFFAAFYVLLFHFATRPARQFGMPAPVVTFLGNGFMGVPFFFLLSGFILTYSYLGQLSSNAKRRRFWEARFSRTYPVYFLSLVLNWPFRGAMSPGTMAAVLTATQAWNPVKFYIVQAWNFPAWTLSVEAFFYLSFPLLLPAFTRLSRRWQTAAMVVLLAAVVLLHTSLPRELLDPNNTGPLRWVPLPLQRLPEFAIGILLCLRFLHVKPKGSTLRIAGYFAAAALMLALLQGEWLSLLVLPFAGLIYELAAGGTAIARLLSTKLLIFLGGASYSIYLLQFPVRDWVRLAVAHLLPGKETVGALASPILLIAFASLVYTWYEEPLRRLLKSAFAAFERRHSPASARPKA